MAAFQQDSAPCTPTWLHHESVVLKCPPQSHDLNPMEHLRDVVEQEVKDMQLLDDAGM